MTWSLEIPDWLYRPMLNHLFQNDLEQGVFLYAEAADGRLVAQDIHFVLPSGWDVQSRYQLVMADQERATVLARARQADLCLVDCHSHPGSRGEVEFSPSDHDGVTDFAQYVRWKLDARPYAALVWGETSADGVVFEGAFDRVETLDTVIVTGQAPIRLRPRGTWELAAWRRDG